jgi:hypothetical protein
LDSICFAEFFACFAEKVGTFLLNEGYRIVVGDLLDSQKEIVNLITFKLIEGQFVKQLIDIAVIYILYLFLLS